MNDAFDFAINTVFEYGVGIEITYQRLSFQSCAVMQHNLVIINPNANDKANLPFVILHELGYIVLAPLPQELRRNTKPTVLLLR